MPVRFRCHGCQRVLSALDRKIGDEVNCPGCGTALVVPAADTVPAPPKIAPQETIHRRDASPPSDPPLGDSPLSNASFDASRDSKSATINLGGIYVSRRVVYAQAVLLALAVTAAFVAGYFIGSADDQPPPATQQGTRSIHVSGRVTIQSNDGQARADAGAAVLILPVEREPRRDAKVQADALNPRQPLPAADDATLSAVEALGGAYARTDDTGGYRVSLPQPGQYHILVLSHELQRGNTLDRVDLATLGEYVFDAIALIGRQRYVLASPQLNDGTSFDHDFRE